MATWDFCEDCGDINKGICENPECPLNDGCADLIKELTLERIGV